MKGEDVLVRGSYNFTCRNITHSQSSRMVQLINVATSIRHNNSNLGGKTDERPCLSPSPTFYDETPFITKIDKGSGGSRRENIWRMFLRENRQSVGN